MDASRGLHLFPGGGEEMKEARADWAFHAFILSSMSSSRVPSSRAHEGRARSEVRRVGPSP